MRKTRDWVARTAVMVVLDETDRCVACTCALCAAKKLRYAVVRAFNI